MTAMPATKSLSWGYMRQNIVGRDQVRAAVLD